MNFVDLIYVVLLFIQFYFQIQRHFRCGKTERNVFLFLYSCFEPNFVLVFTFFHFPFGTFCSAFVCILPSLFIFFNLLFLLFFLQQLFCPRKRIKWVEWKKIVTFVLEHEYLCLFIVFTRLFCCCFVFSSIFFFSKTALK